MRDYVAIDVPADKLKDLLDMGGTKVEAVHRPTSQIGGIIVAEVVEIAPHPDADNLSLVEVSFGSGENARVVCGARNFEIGDRVPLARVGARLPGMEITERKIRGQISKGMLCSGAELGVSKDQSGLLILPPDAQLGVDVVDVLGLDDTIFELEITPNRPDCMSVIGVAREISALLGAPLQVPDVALSEQPGSSPVSVTIDDAEACPRYAARYARDVAPGPSPAWLSARLLSAGLRSISNVVDVTNYVMLETGQPLHAFDAGKVAERKIVVRRARPAERLLGLDETERELHPEDLVIAGRDRPLALAGVMGGADSEVDSATTEIILESAYFDPVTVAYTSRRHMLRTEASARFERGTDPNGVVYAADRAAALLGELAGAVTAGNIVDVYPQRIERNQIVVRPDRARAVIGKNVSDDEQARHLRSVGLEVTNESGLLVAHAPTFRPDLEEEVDLIEEVARLTGYDTIGSTIPPGTTGGLSSSQRMERLVAFTLSALGVQEAWTPSFASPDDADLLGLDPDHPGRRVVRLANPMSDQETCMRTSLLPGLLRAGARSLSHRADGVALFEIARVYEAAGGDSPQEARVLGAVFTGLRRPPAWESPEQRWDFFLAKGILEAAASQVGAGDLRFEAAAGLPFHPTRLATVSVGGVAAGVLGELHPDVCDRFDVPEGTVALEVALAPLTSGPRERVQAEELAKLPATFIDVALVVDQGTPARNVEDLVRKAGAPEVTKARLFDVYRGDQIPAGKKSLAFALELRLGDATVTDEQAIQVRDRIVNAVRERLGGELRA